MGAKKRKNKKKNKKAEEPKEDQEMEKESKIITNVTNKSTKEEVAGFFKSRFILNEDTVQNFIKEYITGDILPDLILKDFKFLGLNLEHFINWSQYYDEKENNFKEDEIKEEISFNSCSGEVEQFIGKYLDFNGYLNNLNGQALFELNEENMEKLGMKLGQRKRLIKYINSLKTKKDQELTINSSKEEVAKFLFEQLNLSKKTVDKLSMPGEELFSIKYDNIKDMNIPESDKDILTKFIIEKPKEQSIIELIKDKNKLNVFEVICFKENYFENTNIYFYCINEKDNIKKNCQYSILNRTKSDKISQKEICDIFLFKIEITDKRDNLYMKMDEINKKLSLKFVINCKNHNFFSFCIFNKGELENQTDNKLFSVQMDTIFNEFSKYILNKKPNNELYEKNMVESLLDIKKIYLSLNNILKVMKLCSKYNLKCFSNINRIIMQTEIITDIEKQYILNDNDISALIKLDSSLKSYIFQLLVYIYIKQLKDKVIISELFEKSKYQKEYFKTIFKLFYNKAIVPKNFHFLQEKEELIQNYLFEESTKKEDINYIIEISSNLEKALKFINEYYIKILEKYKLKKSKFQIIINYNEFEDDINIHNILALLMDIVKISEDNSCYLINYEELFTYLNNKLSSKDINIYFQLKFLIPIFEQYKVKNIEVFYDNFHMKGINLIENHKMTIEEIINFITFQDIYYYSPSPKFRNLGKNDPKIMEYIEITDIDKNYLKTIEIIKKNKLYNLFIDTKKEREFYSVLLAKVHKIKDFQSIFNIFPFQTINEIFTSMINVKMSEIIYQILEMNIKEYEYVFGVFDDWMRINIKNFFEIRKPIEILFINYDIPYRYYIYLLKCKIKEYDFILETMKDEIINNIFISSKKLRIEPNLLVDLLL